MKKILFLIHDLSVGGAEKVLVNLVNNMDYTKFDVTVIALFGGGENEKFLSGKVHYKSIFKKVFPANSRIMKLFSPRFLHRLFIKEKYDCEIAYLEGPSARIISGCPDKDTKLLSWIHGVQRSAKNAAFSFRSYDESLSCNQKFEQIICVSESVKEDFKKIYPQIDNIDVIYNTNDTAKINLLKDEPIENSFFKEDGIKLCGVGRVIPLKCFDKLAVIHNKLRKDGFNVYTYILGIGPDTEKIKAYCKENKIEDSFVFLGYDTNPYKYISKCDAFVCSSKVEGFSTAATEALILGVPVVTNNVAGMREMLGDNEYGVVAPNNDEALYEAIKDLLENPAKLNFYKEKAKERGEFFKTENTVKTVECLLMNL